MLLHINNLQASDIKATGPGGRLTKGDVLAHLGQIPKSAPEEFSKHFNKLSHLDLSNIKPAPPKEPKKEEAASIAEAVETAEEYELALPIDLQPVLKLQQRLQQTLGHAPPLSELLVRAIGLANTDLPARAGPKSANELFDEIVGSLQTAQKVTTGDFVPFINNTPATIPIITQPVDLFDELIGAAPKARAIIPQPVSTAQAGALNEFSVTVSAEDRKRATVFLQRMKSVLEVEPGRLVL